MKVSEFEKIMDLFHKNTPLTLKQRQAVTEILESDNEQEILNWIAAVNHR